MKSILDELNVYYESEDYLYEMANIPGNDVGLPVSLFFSPQPQNHKIRPIRFKVADNPQKYTPRDSLVYSIIENDDGDVVGIQSLTDVKLSPKKEKILSIFILLHFNIIRLLWEEKIGHPEFIDRIRNKI